MKNTFVLRTNYAQIIEQFSDEQAGKLFKAIFAFVAQRGVPVVDDPTIAMALQFIIKDIRYDLEKYNQTCARRAESGRIGGLKTQENLRKIKQM